MASRKWENEDDLDDDERELQKLRQSSHYSGGLSKKPSKNTPIAAFSSNTIQETPEEDENTKLMHQFDLPTSFGTKKANTNNNKVSNDMMQKTKRVGPVRVGPTRSSPSDDNNSNTQQDTTTTESDGLQGRIPNRLPAKRVSQEQEEDEGNINFYKIPFSHEVQLTSHLRMVSALALDPSGSRLLTGSGDCSVKFWDFAGMDVSLRSFRTIEPVEGNHIKSLQYSNSGDKFLVATSNCQAKIYDRDGFQKGECVKGDMYLADMGNTKGHVSALTKASWHPTNKDFFATSSMDGTIRIWDINKILVKQQNVLKAKNQAGKKTAVTTSSYNLDAKLIAGGCQDGSIQLWPADGPYNRPHITFRPGHQDGSDITCLAFSSDGHTLVSRSMDDTMKVWDIRNPKSSLATFDELSNFGETDCIFSPDDRLIVTGTSVKKGEGTGLLVFYDKKDLSRVKQIGVAKGASVVSILWHPKINQIIAGTSEGKTHIYFDPQLSTNGALLSVVRAPRKQDPNDYEPPRPILNPHSLPMYTETPNSKRKEAKARYDPRKSAKIEVAQAEQGPGKAGRIGSSLTQHLMKNYISKDTTREEDPREALLKFAGAEPVFFAAYQKTQPETKFDYSEETEDGAVKPEDKK